MQGKQEDLQQLIDKYKYEDYMYKDAEARYLSCPEGSKEADIWYNDMNRHYEAREKAAEELQAYREQHKEENVEKEEQVQKEEEIDEFEK